MHRKMTWFCICGRALLLWVAAAALAASATSLQLADPSADLSKILLIDAARDPQTAREIVTLSDADLLKRYQTADVYALTDPSSPGPFLATSVQQTSRVTAPASDRGGAEERTVANDKSTLAEHDPNTRTDSAPPPSWKFGPLVATIVLMLLLIVMGWIGYKLRRHSHSRRTAHHSSHRSAHRFIAYDTKRQ